MFIAKRTCIISVCAGLKGKDAANAILGVFDTEKDAQRYVAECKKLEGTYKATYVVEPVAHNLLVG